MCLWCKMNSLYIFEGVNVAEVDEVVRVYELPMPMKRKADELA